MSRHHRSLNARRWARVRRQCFDRDGWRCTVCGNPGRLEAHHVVDLADDPLQDAYSIDGLATYCRGCHVDHHRHEKEPERAAWDDLVAKIAAKV